MTDFETASLLAIDTASSTLRLAVRFGADRLVQSQEQVDRSHGQMIMRKLANLLESGGIDMKQIGGLIVCLGPGSFTGLRVGLAVAKGMAVVREIPIAGVNLFEVAAYKMGAAASRVMVIIPHRRGEYYAAQVAEGTSDSTEVRVVAEAELASLAESYRLIGLGHDEQTKPRDEHLAIEMLEYSASDLLYLGGERLASGRFDQIETLEPLYFGKSQAEIKFEQRHSRQ
jgi:tRNA threonylcarbamoyladenosine biosynthesis protein TsaB